MRIILVLGEKPGSDGKLPDELKDRVEQVPQYINPGDTVIFSGGETTKGVRSEATLAIDYFQKICSTAVDIFSENRAKTTGQNIMYSRDYALNKKLSHECVVVIGRVSQIPKTRVFMKKLWPEARAVFVSCLDTKPLWYRILDQTGFWFLAHIDPKDRLLSIVAKFLRNG